MKQVSGVIIILFLGVSASFSQGLVCTNPVPAVVGLNTAPSAPYWYTYTAPRDELITITSFPSTVDSYLEVISDCSYTEVFISEDAIDVGIPAAYGTLLLSAGQTIYIHWTDFNSFSGFEWRLFTEPEFDFTSPDLFPLDDATDVSIDVNNFVLPFRKPVEPANFRGIQLKRASDSTVVVDNFFKESKGNNLVLTASLILEPNTEYFFEVLEDAVTDKAASEMWDSTGRGVPFPSPLLPNTSGFSDPTIWNFTTGTLDTSNPVIVATTPNSKDDPTARIGLNISLELEPSEPITYSAPAFIEIYRKLDDALVANVDLEQNGNIITDTGTRLSIDVSGLLNPGTEYYVNIPANTLFDLSGKAMAPILDDTTWVFQTVESTNPSDSLALVELYFSFEGGNLAESWLGDLVATWDGITTVGGKVTEVNLAGQELRGTIAPEISNLDQLFKLDLSNNSFSELPDLSGLTLLDTLSIGSNFLEFDDIEPLIGNYNLLDYAPQKNYLNIFADYVSAGSSYTISSAAIAGSNLSTAWYLNNGLIPGETGTTLTINDFQITEIGNYTARVSSTLVPGLEIQAAATNLQIDTTTVGNTQLFEWVGSGPVVDEITNTFTYGSNWVDIDDDGDDDLMLTHFLGQVQYPAFVYENLGNGEFQKVSFGRITEVYSQRFVSWGDFNNDGLPDLVYTLTSGFNALKTIVLQNSGSFAFTELAEISTDLVPGGTIWIDINNDGYLDLARTGFRGDKPVLEFLVGDGQGNFVPTGQELSAYTQYNMQNVDFDNDGDNDLFVIDHGNSSDGRPVLFINDGTGFFQERILLDVNSIWSGSWGDIENDGDLDLFFMNRNFPEGYFLINDGAGNLTPTTMETIVGEALYGRASAFIDVDNNGYVDLVATDRNLGTLAVYLNSGGVFTRFPIGDQIFQSNPGFSGLSMADYDNDGFVDLIYQSLLNDGGTALYKNRGNGNNWLKVDLKGLLSNNDGIGARIEVSTGGLNMARQVQVLTSFASSNSKTAHFGLAGNTTANITVYWPSGLIQVVNGVTANQSITIDEAAIAGDKAALIALYNATDGPNWTNNTNWNTTAPLDQWYGVNVNNDSRVTRLNLSLNNLNGIIPREIGNLTELTNLWIGNNENLTGSIPAEIGLLQQLDTLGLSFSGLSGEIPDELYNLTNLQRLSISNSQLTGELSPRIANLTNLKHIAFWNTPLTGNIPEEFWSLNGLVNIYLGTNEQGGQISSRIGEFSNLEEIWISDCNLSGRLPSGIGRLTNVSLINLSNNDLSGPIPDSLQYLNNLVTLNIQNNNFDVLPDLNRLTSLQTLDISNNKFTYEDILPNQDRITTNTAQKPFGDSTVVQAFTFAPLRLNPSLAIVEGQAYQWYLDGVPLADGTEHYLTIRDFREDDGGVYTLEVIHPDVPGLILSRNPIQVLVNEGDPPQPQAVEVISPNGDYINDEMTIKNIELYPEHRVLIYDVLGRLVYETSEYDNINNPFIGFGNTNGFKELPSGTYYYLIDVGDTRKNGTGYFVMKRQ